MEPAAADHGENGSTSGKQGACWYSQMGGAELMEVHQHLCEHTTREIHLKFAEEGPETDSEISNQTLEAAVLMKAKVLEL